MLSMKIKYKPDCKLDKRIPALLSVLDLLAACYLITNGLKFSW